MWQTLYKILICIIAGFGAGVGTGFAGMSAAVAITPLLIGYLNMEAYDAITIALASDVLASAVSAIVYGKNKNIDIKNGIIMMLTILIFTVVGSFVGQFFKTSVLSFFASLVTLMMGIIFIFKPSHKKSLVFKKEKSVIIRLIEEILAGMLIGFICGFIGAGGGMMMLVILTTVLGYELKTAVGTSVFIMAFTALTGSLSHVSFNVFPDWICLVTCIISTFVFARFAASKANKLTDEKMRKITGYILTIIVIAVMVIDKIG